MRSDSSRTEDDGQDALSDNDLALGDRAVEALASVSSSSYPARRLPKYSDLLPYWKWFKENLAGKTIPTPIGKGIEFKQGHFLKLIAGGKDKGFIPDANNWSEIIQRIEGGCVILDSPDAAPKGFDFYRARNMPLLTDVLQNPHLILRSKDKPSRLVFLKKFKRDEEVWWQGVIADLSADRGAIVSWRPRKKISQDWLKEHWLIQTKKRGG